MLDYKNPLQATTSNYFLKRIVSLFWYKNVIQAIAGDLKAIQGYLFKNKQKLLKLKFYDKKRLLKLHKNKVIYSGTKSRKNRIGWCIRLKIKKGLVYMLHNNFTEINQNIQSENNSSTNICTMFQDYRDVVTIGEVQQMLRIGRNAVYTLLKEQKIKNVRIGKKYIIPKKSVINFLNSI